MSTNTISDGKINSLICVVGGAGYIGSHMVMLLRREGYSVVIIDDLSSGFKNSIFDTEIVIGSILDKDFLESFFSLHKVDAVIHFASSIQVSESVRDPGKYYSNNVTGSLNLLDTMVANGVRKLIFSSTAAIFGAPNYIPIDENHPHNPLSPYGRSKLIVEQVLSDYDVAHGLKSVCLRYFNAAGASQCGRIGEQHFPETHLIPLLLQTASTRSTSFSIFGDDYDTVDGTCVRDYIHVEDLCKAHLLGLKYLQEHEQSDVFNLGTGIGHSVAEVISAVEAVTGTRISAVVKPRRAGDPASLIADGAKAKLLLDWVPERTNLNDIVKDAWLWEQKYPWSQP